MKTFLAWLQAARIPAQTNIAPSLVLGQAIAFYHQRALSWPILIWLVAFGIFDHLYIVFANDLADVETDLRNTTATPFSGGSRVVPQGALTLRALAIAAMLAASLTVAVSGVLSFVYALPLAPLFAFAALALLWAYSFPPFRLSYRGGGELLQTVGIGVVLPVFGFYAQTKTLNGFPVELFAATLPLQLAGAIATALPDAPSDSESSKNTLVVALGLPRAQTLVVLLQGAGLALLLAVAPAGPESLETWAVLAGPLLMVMLQTVTPNAVPGERSMLLRVFLILTANLTLNVGLCCLFFLG